MTNVIASTPQVSSAPEERVAQTADGSPVIDALTGQAVPAHKPADDTEQVYFDGSPRARALPGGTWLWDLLGLALLAVPVAFFFYRGRHELIQPWWINLAIIIVGLVLLTVPWIKAKTVSYRISNYRIDFEHGLFSRDIKTIELWHVEDLRFHQSLFDRLFGIGTITVLSHDELLPKLVLFGLPNPRSLFDTLKQRVIAVKRQSGVIKVDSGS